MRLLNKNEIMVVVGGHKCNCFSKSGENICLDGGTDDDGIKVNGVVINTYAKCKKACCGNIIFSYPPAYRFEFDGKEGSCLIT